MRNGNKGEVETHIKVFFFYLKCTIVGECLRRGRRINAAFSSMWHR